MTKAYSFLLPAALFCAFLPQRAIAQTTPLSDAASARQLLAEATALNDSGQDSLAAVQAERAYHFFRQTPKSSPSDLAEAAYQTGRALVGGEKYEAALPFITASLTAWEGIYPEGSVQESRAWVLLSNAFLRIGKYDDSIEACKKGIALQVKFLPENHPDYANALQLLGKAHIEKSTYREAIPILENGVKVTGICYGKKSKEMAGSLDLLAQAYIYNGSYKLGIATAESALAIQQQILPHVHRDIYRSYMTLGSFHKHIKNYDDALFYFNDALEIQLALSGESHSNAAYCYSEIGLVHLAKNEFSKALEYFQKENAVMLKIGGDKGADYLYTCHDLGRAYFTLGNFAEAIRWHKKALDVERKSSKTDNTNRATLLLYLGRGQLADGQFPEAIESFHADKRILTALYGPEYTRLKETHAELGNAYTAWYRASGQDSLIETARQHYHLAVTIIQKNLREEPLAEARHKALFEAVPIFEKAIGADLLYSSKHPQDPAPLEKAWQLSEVMHSYLLMSASQEANARHFAGIPDEDLRLDSTLRAQITSLEKSKQTLIEGKGMSPSDSFVLSANALIFEKREAHAQLLASFEKNYPDYFRLKYNLETISISSTQRLLGPQQTLLEYFVSDSSIFVFVVQPGGSRVVSLKRDFPLAEWVQDLREGISDYHDSDQKTFKLYEKTVRQYADTAQKLYEKLLAPLAKWLSPELVIVPSESLANLPFEALLSSTPKDLSNFKTYPFLLRKHTVHYAYSTTMLYQMTNRKHRRQPLDGMLAFAPFYSDDLAVLDMRVDKESITRLGHSGLPFSGEEVVRAKKRYGEPSEVFTGEDATKQIFLELAAQYKILHLATHAKANHRDGEFSYLAFSAQDGTTENNLLSVGELYNLSLNAELVLLSACETSIGEQLRGEGVVSIATAFAYAGAKSTVASLWSVNDKSTMLVMDVFYREIKAGKPKNLALAIAKREYLETNPGQDSHPFFWAAFVAVGDMAPIKN